MLRSLAFFRHQRGDIALSLSVLSIVVIAGGVLLGSRLTQETQTSLTEAQTQCQYAAYARVYNGEKGRFFSVADMGPQGPFEIINDRGNALTLNENGRSEASFNDIISLDPTRKTSYTKGDAATVTLRNIISGTHRVKEVFCEQSPGTPRGCPTQEMMDEINAGIAARENDGLTIGNFIVDCGVNTTYGWILEEIDVPNPTPDPTITSVPATPSPGAVGSMEVRVDALNYPQEVPGWPDGYDGDDKPGSCTRQGASENQRPLYLSSFTVKAICVGGGCEIGSEFKAEAQKRQGFVNFTNIPVGDYRFEMEDSPSRGYDSWSECSEKTWTVRAGENNLDATVLLVNRGDKDYQYEGTESNCKDKGGIPNLIEGLPGSGGNMCYFPEGRSEQKPEPTDVPEPTPAESNEIKVLVSNEHDRVRSLKVKLEPCPGIGPCEKTLFFTGKEAKETAFSPGRNQAYDVVVREIQLGDTARLLDGIVQPVQAQTNGIAYVWVCSAGVVLNDGGEDQKCRTHAPGNVTFAVYPQGSNIPSEQPVPEPVPEKPGNPSDTYYGSCPVFESGPCAPTYLARTFTDLTQEELEKMSALCWRESGGSPSATNLSCLNGGEDYSIGLFQINVMKGRTTGLQCVDQVGSVCQENAGTSSCIAPLFNPDTNIEWAKKKWDEQLRGYRKNGFCPWKAGSSDRCKLAQYGDTYRGCWD